MSVCFSTRLQLRREEISRLDTITPSCGYISGSWKDPQYVWGVLPSVCQLRSSVWLHEAGKVVGELGFRVPDVLRLGGVLFRALWQIAHS